MSMVSNLITIIIKSAMNNTIESELVKELIVTLTGDASEKSINSVNVFINSGKARIEQALSSKNMKSLNIPECLIDYVISEIKEILLKTEINDNVLRKCNYNATNLKNFLWNEYYKTNGFTEYASAIEAGLYSVAEVLIAIERESANFEKKLLIQISNSVDETNIGLQKILVSMKKEFSKLDSDSQAILKALQMMPEQIQRAGIQTDNENIDVQNVTFKNNKKQNYIDNWNSRLFLHQDNDERPITLANSFIMPDYKKHTMVNRIGVAFDDTLDVAINKFVQYNKTSTMLIMGVPGIGKSAITSWIANEYQYDNQIIILRFRDWEEEELEKGLLKALYNTLECRKKHLECKILVLDGFDEIKCLDRRKDILNEFLDDMKDFENFKCIIISRPAYIDAKYFENVFEIKEFDIKRVEIFYKRITGKELEKKDKLETNLNVLGVPVILYMAIMSGVDISENPTKPELYNRIFAESGGIFDKFSHNGTSYSTGKQVLRNIKNIKKYLKFLQKAAFMMFEKNTLSLSKKDYEIPTIEFEGNYVNVLEFPIKYLFENVENKIEFIHNSIYEYFVSEYIFSLIKEIIHTNMSEENLAGILGSLLKGRRLSPEILHFLKFKIRSKMDNISGLIYNTFQLMLQDGMTYYTNKCYKNVIKCEINVFYNMLEIIHFWNNHDLKIDCSMNDYLCYNKDHVANLSNMNLSNVNLKNVNLENANLSKANLQHANLDNTNLEGANLSKADLSYANLKGANLEGANLIRTNLSSANLKGANLEGANLIRTNLSSANFNDANLSRAKLHASDLFDTKLNSTNLIEASFIDANMKNVQLEKARLWGTVFSKEQIDYLENSYDIRGEIVQCLPIDLNKLLEKEEYKFLLDELEKFENIP